MRCKMRKTLSAQIVLAMVCVEGVDFGTIVVKADFSELLCSQFWAKILRISWNHFL